MSAKKFFLLFSVFLIGFATATSVAQDILPGVYESMQTSDTVKINSTLDQVERSTLKQKEAYKGALLIRKSGELKSGMAKLKVFKQGKVLLENSIKADSLNAEYRFLRLILQENLPDFLNYHSRKKEDAALIRQTFPSLSAGLQAAIKSYSLKSKVLRPSDFGK